MYHKGNRREIYRVIEIGEDKSLDSLCRAILDSFDFIDEHLYEFCMNNKMYDEHNYQSDPEYSLYYDFGDDWMFVIKVQKIEMSKEKFVLVVIKSKGLIEQYSDWDDDF